ncbi:hypothetical protein [Bacillus taeanensis]|uniref:Uncharacterized protein n=1 Tax=Bacillus taeanensis TaxID=273032 RepID=A0A366XTS1_9BACI|nr:hypothetical protein [Bacillus taeanensis]RBW69542.1 hypothetical protein DS031_11530 [Bacillus taeanensis]
MDFYKTYAKAFYKKLSERKLKDYFHHMQRYREKGMLVESMELEMEIIRTVALEKEIQLER